MASFDFDIGVIGGGPAGLTVASGSAQLGAKTLLIEKESALGGDCLHYGCVPSKTLIRSAQVFSLMKRAGEFGLPEVSIQPVDFREVSNRIKSVIAVIQKHDSYDRFCKLGVRVEFGEPFFADEHTLKLEGERYTAGTWVIATGSSAVIPPIAGLDKQSCITNKEIFYLDKLPGSMIILGAGPIGVEMAQAFARLGTKIDVIDSAEQILPREDGDMAEMAMGVLMAEGVQFHLNASVTAVKNHGMEKEVSLSDIISNANNANVVSNTRSLRAEMLFVATGRSPNVQGLGLESLGIDFDKKGIKVDDRLRTHHRHIYAAGDVNGILPFTHTAGYEGGVVITNAVFHLPRRVNYTYIPWCTYTDPELAGIGLTEKAAKDAGLDYTVWTEEFQHNDRCLAEGETVGRIKMLLDKRERPLGIQILGHGAGELLSEWVAVINGKVKLSALAGAVVPYPTVAEINKKVVSNFFAGKIFSARVKKGLKFFFGFNGRACG
ncbi:MAG: FAD-dependent oxidoreductase [Nitrospirae bacterium]|nr:FAD-dependent oxidoreductase [Nitrospirota bacterium]